MKAPYLLLAVAASIHCHTSIAYHLTTFAEDFADYLLVNDSKPQEEIGAPSVCFDCDAWNRDFVLETKKIDIPEHPFAFNPSIVRWRGKLLMSFRTYIPLTRSTNPFGLIWLSEDFEPIGAPQLFELPFKNPVLPSKQQDPRLIAVGDRLFIAYNNILENVTHREMRRMFLTEIEFDGQKFTASDPECLENFEGENRARYEKNWVPFEHEKKLHLSYSILPHRIFHPLFGQGACATVSETNKSFLWSWGVPRGGTQAILDGDHYIAFFHAWKNLPSLQSGGKNIAHYTIGAYTFESQPPFALIAVSPEPISTPGLYEPPLYKTWKPMRCVFPSGLIVDENYCWIAYGRQDHESWIAKIDKKKLMESLIPVSAK